MSVISRRTRANDGIDLTIRQMMNKGSMIGAIIRKIMKGKERGK